MAFMTTEELKLQRLYYLESIRMLLPGAGYVSERFRERANATIKNINQQLNHIEDELDMAGQKVA